MKNTHALRSATARRVSALRTPCPTVASRPVRRVVTKRTKRVVGYLSSVKMRGLVPWESQLEYDCLRLMEVDNSVDAFFAQPEMLPYRHEGIMRRYYPDLYVEYGDGRAEMVEVKYQADADDPDNAELFAVFAAAYAERGINYRVMTENDVRRQPLLTNVTIMLEDRDRAPNERLKLRVAEAFAVRRPSTLGDLEATLGFEPERRGDLYGMAIRGHFEIDIESAPLSADSRITSPFNALSQEG
ncbi:TnsA endonuclease N-terminal domain-containing protein [Inquilinus sp. CAU 1745]|uniref:TnsA endonuclease N-terminal domain-containing protein n=1 Tax=Inquilinus sp. CAU 1745 TaxID=3140369 RepID=UPI00325A4AA5